MNRVLVIGAKPEEAKTLAVRIGLAGYESAPSASELALALRAAYAFKPDVIVMDAITGSPGRELFQMLDQVSQAPTFVIGDGTAEDDLVWDVVDGGVAYM